MTMTLIQVRDWLKNCAVSCTESSDISNAFLGDMADAIDEHIAGMGEPVAEVYAGAFSIHYIGCANPNKLPVGTKLYTAPPINLAAVRKVIESHITEAKNLRHDPESQDYLYAQADKLEAAIKGEPS